MGVNEILASIDREIAMLQQARALLARGAVPGKGKKRGRPAGKATARVAVAGRPAKKRKKRVLTAEGRKRIAEAQKRRWAASKKSVAVK